MAVTFLTNEDKSVLDQQIETLNDRIDGIESSNGASGVVVDSTLAIEGAAADAAVVGERISEINEEIAGECGIKKSASGTDVEIVEDDAIYITGINIDGSDDAILNIAGKNLLNNSDYFNSIWDRTPANDAVYNLDLPDDATYTLSFTQKGITLSEDEWVSVQVSNDDFVTKTGYALFSGGKWINDTVTFTIPAGHKARVRRWAPQYTYKISDFMADVMLVDGDAASAYVPYVAPVELAYRDYATGNRRLPAYHNYVRITNDSGYEMTVIYNVGGDVYKYIHKSSDSEEQTDVELVYVTPQMFGAVGDGDTDDTVAIQAAIDSGKKVIIPPTSRFYKFTSVVLPANARFEVNGTMETRADKAIKISGENVEISGNGELKYFGNGSLIYIDISGKNIWNTRINVRQLTGNEYSVDTKTCSGIEISLGGSEYGTGFMYHVDSHIKQFNVGIWQHAEENSNSQSWSNGLMFNGLILNCTEAIKLEVGGGGSILSGAIQPRVGSGDGRGSIDKPLITVTEGTTILTALWDYTTQMNKYSLYCKEAYNTILNNMQYVTHKFPMIKYGSHVQYTLPRADFINRPRINGQYAASSDALADYNNILLNAYGNDDIAVSISNTNCTVYDSDAIFSNRAVCTTISKIDDTQNGVFAVDIEFANLRTLKTLCVQSEKMPDSVRFEIYGADNTMLDSVERTLGVDYDNTYGQLNFAAWYYSYYNTALGEILDAKIKRVKMILTLNTLSTAEIYMISGRDGTEAFVSKNGGVMEGELTLNKGLCLFDENGNKYRVTIDADGHLSAELI